MGINHGDLCIEPLVETTIKRWAVVLGFILFNDIQHLEMLTENVGAQANKHPMKKCSD